MQVHWQKLIVKMTLWLTAEIVLSLMGIDTLADYSEFVYRSYSSNSTMDAAILTTAW